MYWYVLICIDTRNAWVLPRRCSVYIYNSQTNDIANYSNSYGKNNKGIRDYLNKQGQNTRNSYGKNKNSIIFEISMRKTEKVLGNFKLSNRET